MLKIRLKRIGRKHDPSFRIVVTEHTAPATGKYLESVGFYNAALKQLELNRERIEHWLSHGVQPTAVVHNILIREGILKGDKIAVHARPKKKAAGDEKPATADAASPASPKPQRGEQDTKEAEGLVASKEGEEAVTEEEVAPKDSPEEDAIASQEAKEKSAKKEAPAEETPAQEADAPQEVEEEASAPQEPLEAKEEEEEEAAS